MYFKKKLNENRVSNLVIIRKNAYFLLKQCILLRRTSFIGWLDFNEWVKSFFFISIENSRNSEPIFLLTCNNFCKSIIKTHKRVNAFVQIHYHKKSSTNLFISHKVEASPRILQISILLKVNYQLFWTRICIAFLSRCNRSRTLWNEPF